MLNLQISATPLLQQWLDHVSEPALRIAVVRALNKTARWLRTQVARDTAKSLAVPVNALKPGLVLLHANRQQLQSGVALANNAGVIKGSALGNPRQTLKGVKVAHRFWGHAFLATMPSGHRGVFKRRGTASLPIQEIQLVTTGRMAKVMEHLADDAAMQYFETLLVRELSYLKK